MNIWVHLSSHNTWSLNLIWELLGSLLSCSLLQIFMFLAFVPHCSLDLLSLGSNNKVLIYFSSSYTYATWCHIIIPCWRPCYLCLRRMDTFLGLLVSISLKTSRHDGFNNRYSWVKQSKFHLCAIEREKAASKYLGV